MTFAGITSRIALTSLFFVLGNAPLHAQGIVQTRATVSPAVPKYTPGQTVSEEIKILGSDTLEDTAAEWDKAFRSSQPQSKLAYNAQRSGDAIQGFIQGKSLIAISARDLSAEELAAFQTKNGYAPIRIPFCLDALIVFVSKGNPINEISLDQLDAIYSSTRLSGTKLNGETWGELGVKGDWKKRAIIPFSREEASAIRPWFLTTVLGKGGKFKDTVQVRTDNIGMAEALVTNPTGISFCSMQAWYASVKVLAIAPKEGQKAEPPTQEAVTNGRYPLVRSFYIFVNRAPGKPLAPAYQEFARFLLSSEGQNVLADTGFIPGPPDFVAMGLKRLN